MSAQKFGGQGQEDPSKKDKDKNAPGMGGKDRDKAIPTGRDSQPGSQQPNQRDRGDQR